MIAAVLGAGVLGVASAEDVRTRTIQAWVPVVLAVLGIGSIILSGRKPGYIGVMVLALLTLGLSAITHQGLGFGDSTVLVAISLISGFRNCVFIISSGALILLLYVVARCLILQGEKKTTDAIPLIPFIFAGYCCWLVMGGY